MNEDKEWKIQVWGTSNDGDGFVQDLGIYEDLESISIHTNMFNNTLITLEQVFQEDKKLEE